jgi:hypothetical protein
MKTPTGVTGQTFPAAFPHVEKGPRQERGLYLHALHVVRLSTNEQEVTFALQLSTSSKLNKN